MNLFKFVGIIAAISFFSNSNAQTPTNPYKIAVFAPIYMDSVFKGNDYKLVGSNFLPKYVLKGLDFYDGVLMAIDSLEAKGISLEVNIYDSKSIDNRISSIIKKPEFANTSLVIASFNETSEIKILADYAAKNEIPLISSTYPNDGGIKDNPYFVIINSSLKTHCQQIYKYVQRNYSLNNLVLVKRKGISEALIPSYFNEMNKTTYSVPLKFKVVELSDTFRSNEIAENLDSTQTNVVICASLNENFGLRVLRNLCKSKEDYTSVAIGMPTWDGIKEIHKMDCDVEVIYSTPYNFSEKNKLFSNLSQQYRAKYFARASDWFYKGFESMYHFGYLLSVHGKNLINHLSDKEYKVFNDFDIQPVLEKRDNSFLYLENKKLYFYKKSDKSISGL